MRNTSAAHAVTLASTQLRSKQLGMIHPRSQTSPSEQLVSFRMDPKIDPDKKMKVPGAHPPGRPFLTLSTSLAIAVVLCAWDAGSEFWS